MADYDFVKTIKTDDRATTMEIMAELLGYSVGCGMLSAEDAILQGLVSIKLKEEDPLIIGYIIRKGSTLTQYGKAYIEELKKNINNSDNKDEVMEIVNKFDSEEDYWNYEFEVYKKLLPVQKYVKSLEKKYVSKHTKQNGNSDVLEKWDKEFEKIKNKLVDEQNYERVKSDNDIDKEFVK